MRRALGLCLGLLACGGQVAPASPPLGPATAGDALLAHAPGGTDAILELDVARLRQNPVVGELLAAAASSPGDFNVLADADVLVICAYDVGDKTRQLVLVGGPALRELGGLTRLDNETAVLGPRELVARAEATTAGLEPSARGERALLDLRGAAMPEGAPGASLRMVATLDFDARVSIASRLDIAEVPTSISLWGDVVDDLAVVAVLGTEDSIAARRLARTLRRFATRIASTPAVRLLGLAAEVAAARVTVDGAAVKVVVTIGPRRLAALTSAWAQRLGVAGGANEPADETERDQKPLADEPQGSASADEPRGAAPADEPRGSDSADEPRGSDLADEPRGAAPADESQGSDSADEPQGSDAADEPRGSDSADEPRGAAPADELQGAGAMLPYREEL